MPVLTCAKLRTGWSLGVVDDADGEAVRDDVGVDLKESSSVGDSLPGDSLPAETEAEYGWPDTPE